MKNNLNIYDMHDESSLIHDDKQQTDIPTHIYT